MHEFTIESPNPIFSLRPAPNQQHQRNFIQPHSQQRTKNMNSESSLIVHHLENSRSQRIVWLLEELNVPFTVKVYKRTDQQLAPPELKAIHPLGKSPVITDGDLVVAESGTIIEYLLETYGNGRFQPPSTKEARLRNSYYTQYAEGSLMPLIVDNLLFNLISTKVPWPLRLIVRPIMDAVNNNFIVPNIVTAADMIEKDIAKSNSGWIAGGPEPTSGDFMMFFALERLPSAIGADKVGSRTKAWLRLIQERPAYKRALRRVGRDADVKY
ncbi:hypothetical protein FRC18_004036 [Serendipita sp. 400]|nr:hypothetical protein FRC18_004036 [Serendipita sp. 400]